MRSRFPIPYSIPYIPYIHLFTFIYIYSIYSIYQLFYCNESKKAWERKEDGEGSPFSGLGAKPPKLDKLGKGGEEYISDTRR